MANKLKAGIIGCGGIANGKHMPSIKALGETELVAFCDLIIERAEKAKAQYGTEDAQVFTDYKELLKLDLDCVYVCTPNRSHSYITVDALHAGKNVMCEKPMAINPAEAQKMLDAAKETGKNPHHRLSGPLSSRQPVPEEGMRSRRAGRHLLCPRQRHPSPRCAHLGRVPQRV